MNQCYFLTHFCFFIHVPGEGNSNIGNLFDVANRIKALLVISCDMKKKKKSVLLVTCIELSFSNGETATLPIQLAVAMATLGFVLMDNLLLLFTL